MQRRTFLRSTALAAAGSTLLSKDLLALAGKAKGELTGVQLYSVRDDMKKDPLATLKAVAEMGYKHVEHANYVDRKFYGWSAKEFRKILDDLGLKMPSGHTVMTSQHWDEGKKDFTDAWKWTVEDAAITMEVITGFDAADPAAANVPPPKFRAGLGWGVQGLKIAIPRHFYVNFPGVSQETIDAIDRTAEQLAKRGDPSTQCSTAAFLKSASARSTGCATRLNPSRCLQER